MRKNQVVLLALTLASLGCASTSVTRTSASAHPASRLDVLRFMIGDWEGASSDGAFDEHWTDARGDLMIGVGRELAPSGKLSFWELMRIEARPDGIYLVPQPFGRPPHDFKLTTSDASHAVFESAGDDKVQRITYARGRDETLAARVEGDNEGKKIDDRYVLHRAH
jgi:hypothetical protein